MLTTPTAHGTVLSVSGTRMHHQPPFRSFRYSFRFLFSHLHVWSVPGVRAEGLGAVAQNELVRLGRDGIWGEVVRLESTGSGAVVAAIEAFEDAQNAPGEAVSNEELTATSLASIAASLEYQNMLTLDDAEVV